MKTTNSDPVQDYILEDEDHMRIAAAVFDAWPEVRNRLVSAFLDRLERALKQKKDLKEWEFERWNIPFINEEAGFDFGKAIWKKAYYVGLHFWSHGHQVTFGLGRDASKRDIEQRRHDDKLLAAVTKRHASAKAGKWWEANVRMQPEDDWQKPEVLWRLRDENDEFLNEVAAQLLEVARISAPFVDQLAGKK